MALNWSGEKKYEGKREESRELVTGTAANGGSNHKTYEKKGNSKKNYEKTWPLVQEAVKGRGKKKIGKRSKKESFETG